MIIDVKNFIAQEQKYWDELDQLLNEFESEPVGIGNLGKLKRLHYLYQRASADLARIMSFSSERLLKENLESLVSRAYGEIHETRPVINILSFFQKFFLDVPIVFQKYQINFVLSCLIFISGSIFGGLAVSLDPGAKEVLMPFYQLQQSPQERVAWEEKRTTDPLQGHKDTFSSFLWVHNTQVAIMIIAFGITWGIGTVLMVFYNGIILGAVAIDYFNAGQVKFLLGWLLPHGVIEIPAFLIAGQVGLIFGNAMIGWGDTTSLQQRLRRISGDMMVLSLTVALMLSWAGFVEAFISQYHWPVISYNVKIGFGILELIVLISFLYQGVSSSNELQKKKTTNN
ncbi:MAG: stage II sporulation protein M [Candidatus Omnitrophica bacterium]|nr:stage II sporulation protein M [Candidatus Omnitrophota bacterium]